MNGHFSTVGDKPGDVGSYEHGVQVIDEDKDFKYASRGSLAAQSNLLTLP